MTHPRPRFIAPRPSALGARGARVTRLDALGRYPIMEAPDARARAALASLDARY